jgi:hypothetical protein
MYEAYPETIEGLTLVQVLLTVVAFEFFGPIKRDTDATHLFNPEWVGHARFHLVWQLGMMFFAGGVTLWLIWWTDPLRPVHLYLASALLAANLLGFWAAVALVKWYKGIIWVPLVHIKILGVDENVFVFSVLSLIFLIALAVLMFHVGPQCAPDILTATLR